LATATSASNAVTTLINDGAGSFTFGTLPAAGNSPTSLALADVDADTDLDLAVVNTTSDMVTILMNNGNGNFSQSSTVIVGDHPTNVIVSDFDNDGDIDLAIVNGNDHNLSILRNDGMGNFMVSNNAGPSYHPYSTVSGDFDNDGAIDLAVANPGSFNITLLKNIPITAISENENKIPKRFELYQNYPNPFNALTLISFSLPGFSFVTLKVYDVLGKEVQTLVSEQQIAGIYSVDFDAGSLPGGVYFYRLETQNFTETKKMLLMP